MISNPEEKKAENPKCEDLPILCCPIKYTLMTDPVVELSGQSAERGNIMPHVRSHGRCLFNSNLRITPKQLITNSALKYLIQYYQQVKDSEEFVQTKKFNTKDLINHYQLLAAEKIKQLKSTLADLNLYLPTLQQDDEKAQEPWLVKFSFMPPLAAIDWPFALICPLSLAPVTKPVISVYGHTYEGAAIKQIVTEQKSAKDPLANRPLTLEQLIPNLNLQWSNELLNKQEFETALLQGNEAFKTQLSEIRQLFTEIHEVNAKIAVEEERIRLVAEERARIIAEEKAVLAAQERRKRQKKYICYTFAAAGVFAAAGIVYRFMNDACYEPIAEWSADNSATSYELEPVSSHWMVEMGREMTKSFLAGGCSLWTMAAPQVAEFFTGDYAAHEAHLSICRLETSSITVSTFEHCEKAIDFVVKQRRSDLLPAVNAENVPYTALRYAAERGYYGVISKLLKLGANINQLDRSGYTPLRYAILNSRTAVVDLFIKEGADLTSPEGASILSFALQVSTKNVAIIRSLVTARPELVKELQAESPQTLHNLVKTNNREMLELLLATEPILNKEKLLVTAIENYCQRHISKADDYFLTYMAKAEALETIKFLLDQGAKVNQIFPCAYRGDYGVHCIWRDEHIEAVSLLLNAGLPVNAVINDVLASPLQIAIQRREAKLAALLREREAELKMRLERVMPVTSTTYLSQLSFFASNVTQIITKNVTEIIEDMTLTLTY